MTQKGLSEELGVAEQTVSRWFRGETRPSDRDVERLRRILAWTDNEISSIYIGASPTHIDPRELGLPERFPELGSLLSDHRGARALASPGLHRALDSRWYRSPGLDAAQQRLLRTPPDHAVISYMGHGLSTLADRLVSIMSAESVLRRSIVLFASIESVAGAAYGTLLSEARDSFHAMHPLAGSGHWNPDHSWARDEAERVAHRWLHQATDGEHVSKVIRESFAEQIFRSMSALPWERSLPRPLYSRLLGATDGAPLPKVRAALDMLAEENPMASGAWNEIQQTAPLLHPRWQSGACSVTSLAPGFKPRSSGIYRRHPSAGTSSTRSLVSG